ncbi:hypothetical protein B0H10DRAFT_2004484 [Mycena sp. CBHHK59/15]|nr:hypothetical protein B0H10DRAFT_2004484 [Mycena sp. CBHHK59/15]
MYSVVHNRATSSSRIGVDPAGLTRDEVTVVCERNLFASQYAPPLVLIFMLQVFLFLSTFSSPSILFVVSIFLVPAALFATFPVAR